VRELTVDRAAGMFFTAFSVLVLWESRKIPFGTMAEPGPGALPVLLALILLVCSVAVFLGGRVGERLADVRWTEWRHAVAILGTCSFMALALERLGYRPTMTLACAFLLGVVERKGPLTTLLFSVGLPAGTYYLFDTLLRVQLPRGPFGL